jgi:hypothetical protein
LLEQDVELRVLQHVIGPYAASQVYPVIGLGGRGKGERPCRPARNLGGARERHEIAMPGGDAESGRRHRGDEDRYRTLPWRGPQVRVIESASSLDRKGVQRRPDG